MRPAFCRSTLVLVLLCSLHVIVSEVVSSDEPSRSDMIPMMVAGARVVRGKDWEWGDQDGSPPTVGTVLRPFESSKGWFIVQWGNLKAYSYRMGFKGKCDLKIVQQNKGPVAVSSETLVCRDASKMVAGAKVVRGKDWGWGNQDGTPPTQGTILRGLTDGWVRVQWADNSTNSYRMGADGKCDLEIVDQRTEPTVPSSSSTTQSTSFSSSVTTPQPESSTDSSPPSPTRHQCTCSKEISDSQARTEAETAELAKEAGRLAVETAKVALEAAKATARAEEAERLLEFEAKKVALEAAKSHARTEETKRLLEVETMKVALESAKSIAKADVESKQVYLEAAKSIAKAEETWATYAAEELQHHRNMTLHKVSLDVRQI